LADQRRQAAISHATPSSSIPAAAPGVTAQSARSLRSENQQPGSQLANWLINSQITFSPGIPICVRSAPPRRRDSYFASTSKDAQARSSGSVENDNRFHACGHAALLIVPADDPCFDWRPTTPTVAIVATVLLALFVDTKTPLGQFVLSNRLFLYAPAADLCLWGRRDRVASQPRSPRVSIREEELGDANRFCKDRLQPTVEKDGGRRFLCSPRLARCARDHSLLTCRPTWTPSLLAPELSASRSRAPSASPAFLSSSWNGRQGSARGLRRETARSSMPVSTIQQAA
jgi:hypothetical protein